MNFQEGSSQLIYLATKFRNAIEAAKENGSFCANDRMRLFPKGCCDDTCDLLGLYLLVHNIPTVQINGEYRDDNPFNTQNHVWLQLYSNTIIDITGDQFSTSPIFNNTFPVYVGKENDFYRLFTKRSIQDNFDFVSCNSSARERMRKLYNTITEYL